MFESLFGKKRTTDDEIPNDREIRWQQKAGAAAFCVLVVGAAVWGICKTDSPTRKPRVDTTTTFSLTDTHADRDAFYERYDARISQLEQALRATRRDNEAMTQSLADMSRQTREHLDQIQKDFRDYADQREPVTAQDPQAMNRQQYLTGMSRHFPRRADGSLNTDASDAQVQDAYINAVGTVNSSEPESLPAGTDGLTIVSLATPETVADNAVATPRHNKPSQARHEVRTRTLTDTPLAPNRAAGTADYIPAGSFVRGVLLSGVYTPTGANALSQPRPVVIRLTRQAILPNKKRSNIASCHATASASGNLSSERVEIRLDRLTCIRPDGQPLDVRATGYVVGEDGKVGLRGRLISRSGQAIASALSVGILSGLGQAVSDSAQSVTTSITGTQTKEVKNAWLNGLGHGTATSMERIVDYYLKLAEQIFPVLEINAGREVDIVFSQGVMLRDKTSSARRVSYRDSHTPAGESVRP